MAGKCLRIPISDLAKQTTLEIEITGATVWRWRLRLAKCLIRLAARVLGTGIRIHNESEDRKEA